MKQGPSRPRRNPTERFLLGGGEMGRRIRDLDWSKTPVGPVSSWPQSLRTAVRLMLDSRYAMWLGWGPALTFFCNDAYLPTLGNKQSFLGASARDVWAEVWADVGPRAETVMNTGVATWDEGLLLFLERRGYPEETYHTFSYSPLYDDEGLIGGMLCVVTEDTERTVGERRLKSLRALSVAATAATTAEEACTLAAHSLADNPQDLPFALFYLLDGSGEARLAASTGLRGDRSPAAVPLLIPKAEGQESGPVWPFAALVSVGDPLVVEDVAERFGVVQAGAWPEAIERAKVLPLFAPGPAERVTGFLVAGISPRRPLNQGYRDFLRLVAGQVSSAIADARAYEEERRTAKALAELDQAKTTFFSNVSHELRTPLTLVLGPLEELLRAGGESPERRELLSVAHRNGQRLLKLVNTLLEVSRLEAGRVRAAYEPMNLAAYTADVASTFRSTMEKAELRFVVACEPLPGKAFVDAEMWEKIVLNLLSNAFKFTLRGEVQVGLRAEAGRAVLTVQDTGTGIPAEALPRLFDRFFRLEGGRGRTSEGTGIGLALVHELVRLHGGTIDVKSRLGAGSTFTVAIPLGRAHLPADQVRDEGEASAMALRAHPYVEEALRWLPDADLAPERALGQAPSRADVDEAVGGRERIPAGLPRVLVADDNADMRGYLCRLLGADHEVATVANGEEALREAARQVPDLVLADVMMPELDGFALLKALRSDPRTAAVPVILLSARAGEEARIEGLEAGAEDYLVKPFGARELLARVGGTLALAEQRRAARRREDDLRRAHEAELQRSHAELEAIYSSTPVGLCLLDRELRYVRINETLARMNGLPAAQHLGRTVREMVPHLADQVEPAFRRVLETGVPLLDVELGGSTIGEPGVERTWLESWYPQHDVSGAVVGVNVVAMEITDRKRAERALKESDARKDEFLATLAHELRNPLAPIRNALGVLRLAGGSAEGTQLVEMMERQVHQMVRLVDDLLDVSRINRGSIELRRRSVGLGAIVESAIETSRPLLEAGGHRLSVELPREPIVLNADAERLSQVLSNILNNAAKYTEVPGHIQLEALAQGTEAVVSVRDDGRGIKAELLPRIFDMFTGANRDAGRSGGLGIGLALARKIVEMHGGRIEARSEGPGCGTELRVTLPVAAAAADELPKRERERGRSLQGLRVLVVDDNRDSAESLGMMLELYGAQVAVSYDGPSALSSFSETAPSIVLLDLGMPGMDGFEVARRIRQQDGPSAVTLIALSGWGQEDDRRRTRAEGFDHHLVKPVDPDTLLRLLGPRSSPRA